MPPKPNMIYQIKVTLKDTHPPVWWRIQVPSNTTLLKLHDILQIVMGWEDYHLHMFTIAGSIYGDPADDEFGDLGTIDEARCKLNQVIQREGQRFSYEYDFGDGWNHNLLVERILSPKEGTRYPVCLKGMRACPPEDVGGVCGYENFLEAIRDPDHYEHEDYLTWIGGEFEPEAYNQEDINEQLRHMGRGRSSEDLSVWSIAGNELTTAVSELDSPWSRKLPDDQKLVAEELPLRRDVITLLTYLRDNKVTGTQATGNLPLKAVYAICARFVDPPQLEKVIGEHVYHVRSETEVWSLYFSHILASVSGLITGGMSRRWKLTEFGERFLASPSPCQVWHLFTTWWMQTNWAVASRFDFEDGFMPPGFSRLALKHILALPSGETASFAQFADLMIEKSRMVWAIQDQDTARFILRSIIEHTVINPLVDFGILQTEYKPHTILGMEFRDLSTFEIMPFGKSLLVAIHHIYENSGGRW